MTQPRPSRRAGPPGPQLGAGGPGAVARSAAALIIGKWAGHYDSSFTMKTYVHASDDDLKQGRQALAKIRQVGRTV